MKFLATVLLVCVLYPALASAAEVPAPVAQVGYIRADAQPAANVCTQFDGEETVAWDYGNRSLVVALPRACWVTRIVVTSNVRTDVEPKLTAETVGLYVSRDNQTYARYSGPLTFRLTRAAEAGKVWRAEFAGLGCFGTYFKLKQAYNGADYGFGIEGLKAAVEVFTDDSFGGDALLDGIFVEAAQPAGRMTAEIRVRGARTAGTTVEVEVWNTESLKAVAQRTITRPGERVPVVLRSRKLTQGGYWLKVRLRYRDFLLDEKEAAFRVHAEVADDAGPSFPEVKPGGAVVLRDLPRWCAGAEAFAYALPSGPRRTCQGIAMAEGGRTVAVHLPLSGEYAVYLAVDTPWPALKTTLGERQTEIPATPYDWPAAAGEQELFAGYGDFTAGPLLIEAPTAALRIRHIRVARLTAAETELMRYKADPTHNRRVIYNNDGFSELWGVKGWDKARLLKLVERYAGTDTEIFEMAALVSGWVNYPSKYATFWRLGEVPENQWLRVNDKMAVELFTQLEADGLPIFPTLAQRGRELGIPVFGSLRMSGYYGLQEQQTMQPFNGKLWHEHPEMRIRRRDGEYDTQMSFAWEAVRAERLGVLRELLEMGCEGVMMDFCRYPEILGYDEPWVQGFKDKYGISPLDLPADDARWIGYRCDRLNDFFRAVRRQTDEIARTSGRTLRISVRLPATGYREYGFDPQTWARERLMDIFIPHYPGLERDFDLRPWVAMVKGTGIKLYPGIEVTKRETANTELTDAELAAGIKPGLVTSTSRDEYQRKAWLRYRLGADGVFLFNTWTIGVERNLLGDQRSLQRWSTFEDAMNLPRQSVAEQ